MSRSNASRHAPEEVDAYLAALPDEIRASLERIRRIIEEIAPDCTERVSYSIPIFRLQKDLVGISAQKNHCSFHSMSPSLMKAMAEELKGVKVSGATIQFTPETPLSKDLIANIVRERMKEVGNT